MSSITVEPCTFALFGALGDLALRKLFPALYQLDRAGLLHDDTRILALAREPGDARTLERRVRAFARLPQGVQRRPRWAHTNGADAASFSTGSGSGSQAIYLLPESKTLCRYVWDNDAARTGPLGP